MQTQKQPLEAKAQAPAKRIDQTQPSEPKASDGATLRGKQEDTPAGDVPSSLLCNAGINPHKGNVTGTCTLAKSSTLTRNIVEGNIAGRATKPNRDRGGNPTVSVSNGAHFLFPAVFQHTLIMNQSTSEGAGAAPKTSSRYLISALLALAFLGEGGLCLLNLWSAHRIEYIQQNYLPVEDHNNLVQAHNQMAGTVTNQQSAILRQQVGLQELQAGLQAFQQQVNALTNLYVKMDEYERQLGEKAQELRTLREEFQSLTVQEGLAGTNTAQLSLKLDSLQKGLIKMSLAVQSVQHDMEGVVQFAQTALSASHPVELSQTSQTNRIQMPNP